MHERYGSEMSGEQSYTRNKQHRNFLQFRLEPRESVIRSISVDPPLAVSPLPSDCRSDATSAFVQA